MANVRELAWDDALPLPQKDVVYEEFQNGVIAYDSAIAIYSAIYL